MTLGEKLNGKIIWVEWIDDVEQADRWHHFKVLDFADNGWVLVQGQNEEQGKYEGGPCWMQLHDSYIETVEIMK